MTVFIAFGLAGLTTFALRSFMTIWGHHLTDSEQFGIAVALVAPAVLAAIVGSSVFLQDQEIGRPELAEMVAVIAAMGVVKRTGNVGTALFVGLPVYWLGSLIIT